MGVWRVLLTNLVEKAGEVDGRGEEGRQTPANGIVARLGAIEGVEDAVKRCKVGRRIYKERRKCFEAHKNAVRGRFDGAEGIGGRRKTNSLPTFTQGAVRKGVAAER